MLLKELVLIEDLGNLNQVDKDLRPALMGIRGEFMSKQDIEGKKRYKDTKYGHQRKSKLMKSAGKDSEFEIVKFKNMNNAKDAINQNVGVLLVLDGEQVAIVAGDTSSSRSGPAPNYNLIIKSEKIKEKMSEEDWKNFYKKFEKLMGYFGRGSIWKNSNGDNLKDAEKYITALRSFSKKMDGEVEWMAIKPDEKRKAKGHERESSRVGKEYKPKEKGFSDYIKNFSSKLSSRLDKFKNSRLKEYPDVASLLEAMEKEGYFDKFLIDGYVYNYYRDDISLDRLKGKDSWNKDASIEYKIDINSDKYEEMKSEQFKQRKAIRNMDIDEETKDELIGDLYNSAPPRQLKVILGFDGGHIIPKSIDADSDVFY